MTIINQDVKMKEIFTLKEIRKALKQSYVAIPLDNPQGFIRNPDYSDYMLLLMDFDKPFPVATWKFSGLRPVRDVGVGQWYDFENAKMFFEFFELQHYQFFTPLQPL